ncbi:unnamed protein product [Spodoptera littoralis]|uniref:G-protein coupled receptors family 1 profile domain-containing protein n=1 Tax=Spodoptera littoralis TaxID=7109 RepID=A0A9P0N9M8_SPOLI|nr:unnamed protein product [Spodoptera littoralis]CAH1647456.1 unnamed protein product [Spodoptera littoralis]
MQRVAKQLYPVIANSTRTYSPITLCREWSTLGRLVLIVFCACFASTINGFFVSAFFVEHSLKRIVPSASGNVFHACVGIADLFITAGVLPIAAVVLLSGVWDTISVCQGLQFLTEASTYCYSIFFFLVAAECYVRICHPPSAYEIFINMRVGLVSTLVFVVGMTVAAVGTFFGLDYDYCERSHHGNYTYRLSTSIIFHGIPFILTSYTLIASSIRINQHSRLQAAYKRSLQYNRDLSLIKINILAYFMYVIAWTPFLVILYRYPNIADNHFYQSAWAGISRSLFTSLMYGFLNASFGRAYANLFYYCCCKSSLNGTYHSRHRRTEYRPTTDVRVHIMHQAMSVNSPQRGASTSRDTQEL